MRPNRKSWSFALDLVRDRRGQVAVTSAILLPVACVLAALAVDEGALFAERRNMQGLTDLAAIAAATAPNNARATALRTFADNGFTVGEEGGKTAEAAPTGAVARIETGRYERRDAVAVEERFVPDKRPANAARVTLFRTGTQYFSAGFLPPPRLQTTAIAHASAQAAFSVGSRLLALEDGVANAVLGALVGTKLSLSVMDYRALAGARVDVPTLLDRTARSFHVQAATYSELLRTDLPLADLFGALADLPALDKQAAPALRALSAAAPRQRRVRLGDLFDLGPAASKPLGASGIAASAAVGDIVRAAAAIANRNHQVEVALAGAYPGLLGVRLHIAIGEPMQASPWLGSGEEGTVVRTAQTRVLLLLDLPGPGGPLGASVRLPVYAEAAFAEAKLAEIRCRPGRPEPAGVTLLATPGLARLRIADIEPGLLADFKAEPSAKPTRLVETPLAAVSGSALLEFSDYGPARLTFLPREIADGVTKQVSSRGFLAAPVVSLLSNLRLDAKVLGLGATTPSALTATLGRSLADHEEMVDALLEAVLATLGVSLGQADVTVNGAVCNRAVLVQ